MDFEWDGKKAEANEAKHGVSFREASTLFSDPLAITFADPDHSLTEDRYITLELSRFNRLLAVSHTEREGRTGIISARPMTAKERGIYENG